MSAPDRTIFEVDGEVARLRIPPQSQEAEQSVLGGLLIDNDAWDRVGDILTGADFYRHEHRVVFEAVAKLLTACKPADVVTVHAALVAEKGDRAEVDVGYLNALSNAVPSARNIRRYAEIVREKAILRAVIATADNAAAQAFAGGTSATEVLDAAAIALDKLQRDQVQHKPREAAQLAVARMDHYNDLAMGNVEPGRATGFAQLDEALNGGLQPGRVYVLAARPSVGKTSLAMQIGLRRADAGDGVLLLSQEMPNEECTDRALCNLGPVDYGNLQRGKLNDLDWRGMTEATEKLGSMRFWIDDQAALTIRDIRAKAMSLRREGLRLLVVDYLQLCAGMAPGKGVTRNNELEEICRGLKTLAKQLGIPVLLLSQLSREVEKRADPKPTLADLRDSGAIEQDADVVLFLRRVRQLGNRMVMGLSVAKNRQGEIGQDIPLEFRGAHQRWHDSEADLTPAKPGQSKGGFE